MSRPQSNGEFVKETIEKLANAGDRDKLTDAERELRNIYAGLALPAVINNVADVFNEDPKLLANVAFTIADAMIIRSRK
jgi:hypothetical protein